MNDRDEVVREMRQLAEAGEAAAAWQLYDWADRLQAEGKAATAPSGISQSDSEWLSRAHELANAFAKHTEVMPVAHPAPAPVVTEDSVLAWLDANTTYYETEGVLCQADDGECFG